MSTPSGGELRGYPAAGPAPASDGLHDPSLLTASPLRPRPASSIRMDGQGMAVTGASPTTNEAAGVPAPTAS